MKKGVIAGIVLAVVAGFFISKNIIQNSIDEGLQNLNQYGLNCKVTKNEGFFNQKREFNLEIKDGNKLKEKYIHEMGKIVSEYKVIADILSKKLDKSFGKSLEKLQFKGSITNSNLNPFADVKANIYLSDIKDMVKKPPILQQMLDKKTLNFDLSYNNKGKLKNLKLKNIDDKFTDKKESVDTKVIGFNIKNKPSENKIVLNMSLKTLSLDFFKQGTKEGGIGFDGLTYNIDYKNMYDSSAEASFSKMTFKDEKSGEGISIGKSKTASTIKNKNDKCSLNTDFTTEDIEIKARGQSLKIEDIEFDMQIKDFDAPTYKKILASNVKTTAMALNKAPISKIRQAQEEQLEHMKTLVQKGFKIKFDFGVKGVQFLATNIENAKLKIDSKILPNSNNLQGLDVLNIFDIKANLSLTNEDFDTISKLAPPQFFKMAQAYAKKEGNKTIFELILKDGKPTINGKPLM